MSFVLEKNHDWLTLQAFIVLFLSSSLSFNLEMESWMEIVSLGKCLWFNYADTCDEWDRKRGEREVSERGRRKEYVREREWIWIDRKHWKVFIQVSVGIELNWIESWSCCNWFPVDLFLSSQSVSCSSFFFLQYLLSPSLSPLLPPPPLSSQQHHQC